MKHVILLSTAFLTIMLLGCSPDADFPIPDHSPLPDEIEVVSPGLYPEGITFSPLEGVFYLSSLKKGNILRVKPDGSSEFVTSEEGLVSTAGIKYNKWKRKLVACNTDIGLSDFSDPSTIGVLGEYKTVGIGRGKGVQTIDIASAFAGPHAINDVVLSPNGKSYLTDSFSPVIYEVSKRGEAKVLLTDEAFTPLPGNFGLNGIEYHPDKYLIVAKYDESKLFKVSLKDLGQFKEITLSGLGLSNLDGLLLLDSKTLLAVGNNLGPATNPNGVYKIVSEDNWNTAEVVDVMATPDNFPTTLTKAKGEPYVLFAEIDELIGGVPSDDTVFKIKKVSFGSPSSVSL